MIQKAAKEEIGEWRKLEGEQTYLISLADE
jgi:hypothetical protein